MSTTVCVTGASGYVASHLVKLLLEKGYNVRGTVRSLKNEEKVAHLLKIDEKTPGKLTLIEADLLKDGSFDEAIKGSTYVFHTASPFQVVVDDPQRDLVDPALKGTQNVLRTAAKYKDTVKRVVLTSSVAAIINPREEFRPKNGVTYTEEDWNQESSLDKDPYSYSKTVAEKEAWKIAKESGLDLVVINPSFVIGPALFKRLDGMSMNWMKAILDGKKIENRFATVDVRDIAKAHVAAAENSNAKGRYIVSSRKKLNPRYTAQIVKKVLPDFKINVDECPEFNVEEENDYLENSKVQKELGIELIPFEKSVEDMALSFVELGIV